MENVVDKEGFLTSKITENAFAVPKNSKGEAMKPSEFEITIKQILFGYIKNLRVKLKDTNPPQFGNKEMPVFRCRYSRPGSKMDEYADFHAQIVIAKANDLMNEYYDSIGGREKAMQKMMENSAKVEPQATPPAKTTKKAPQQAQKAEAPPAETKQAAAPPAKGKKTAPPQQNGNHKEPEPKPKEEEPKKKETKQEPKKKATKEPEPKPKEEEAEEPEQFEKQPKTKAPKKSKAPVKTQTPAPAPAKKEKPESNLLLPNLKTPLESIKKGLVGKSPIDESLVPEHLAPVVVNAPDYSKLGTIQENLVRAYVAGIIKEGDELEVQCGDNKKYTFKIHLCTTDLDDEGKPVEGADCNIYFFSVNPEVIKTQIEDDDDKVDDALRVVPTLNPLTVMRIYTLDIKKKIHVPVSEDNAEEYLQYMSFKEHDLTMYDFLNPRTLDVKAQQVKKAEERKRKENEEAKQQAEALVAEAEAMQAAKKAKASKVEEKKAQQEVKEDKKPAEKATKKAAQKPAEAETKPKEKTAPPAKPIEEPTPMETEPEPMPLYQKLKPEEANQLRKSLASDVKDKNQLYDYHAKFAETLNAMIPELEMKVEEMADTTAAATKIKTTFDLKRKRIDELTKDKDHKASEYDKIKRQCIKDQQLMEEYETTNKHLDTDLKESAKEIAVLKKRVNELESDLNASNMTVDVFKEDLAKAQSDKSKVEAENSSLTSKLQHKCMEFDTQSAELTRIQQALKSRPSVPEGSTVISLEEKSRLTDIIRGFNEVVNSTLSTIGDFRNISSDIATSLGIEQDLQ